jgi:hypothetical protein
MITHTLTDASLGLHVDSFSIAGAGPGGADWSVRRSTLRGGRRDGVDLIEVDNGALAFSIVPTRGMGLWKGRCRGLRLGWDSPVSDGPVNPAFVNLLNWNGLGWLEGFDELLARCGLAHSGAPYTENEMRFGLHGKIANTPAHYVAVHVDEGPESGIAVEGRVDESALFQTQVRLISTVSTRPGSHALSVRDEFRNMSNRPQEFQILYHWNFGPPILQEGARFSAAVKTVVPRNARAVDGLGHYDVYGPPDAGFAEQVYFFELHAGPDGRTVALLRDRAGAAGVALRYDVKQLPAFTLWKNTGGLKSGYVTGLEPGTNYPNPTPFERQRGRTVKLAPGASHLAETTLEVLPDAAAVGRVEEEIRGLQKLGAPTIHKGPLEPYAAE